MTLLVATMVVLTIEQRAYLRAQGWSPVHRTPTEWPSLLATGPGGWALSVAFVATGAALALCAVSVFRGRLIGIPLRRSRLAGVLLVVSAVGLLGVAFPADPATSQVHSWHASVHDLSYPFIPLGVILASAVIATAKHSSPLRKASRAMLPLCVVTFGSTASDAVAQVARYPAFACVMVWVVVLTRHMQAVVTPEPQRQRSIDPGTRA